MDAHGQARVVLMQLPEIPDEFMRESLPTARSYTVVILKKKDRPINRLTQMPSSGNTAA